MEETNGVKEFKKPIKVFRSRGVQGSIWENKNDKQEVYYSVTFVKSWKDNETQQWKNTQSFNKSDLGDLLIVTNLISNFLNKE